LTPEQKAEKEREEAKREHAVGTRVALAEDFFEQLFRGRERWIEPETMFCECYFAVFFAWFSSASCIELLRSLPTPLLFPLYPFGIPLSAIPLLLTDIRPQRSTLYTAPLPPISFPPPFPNIKTLTPSQSYTS